MGAADGPERGVHEGRGHGEAAGERRAERHALIAFLRSNPQVLVLLVICVVLGLGTFLAVIFGLLAAGSSAGPTGEPSGLIVGAHAVMAAARSFLA